MTGLELKFKDKTIAGFFSRQKIMSIYSNKYLGNIHINFDPIDTHQQTYCSPLSLRTGRTK